ncbi:hypothetical protein EJB05_13204, partial [Eragrostis curvula]
MATHTLGGDSTVAAACRGAKRQSPHGAGVVGRSSPMKTTTPMSTSMINQQLVQGGSNEEDMKGDFRILRSGKKMT